MSRKKTNPFIEGKQIEANERVQKNHDIAFATTQIVKTGLVAGSVFGSVWVIMSFIFQMTSVLAGQETQASIAIGFLADIRLTWAISFAIGGGGLYYGHRQNKLRRRTIERLGSQLKSCEEQLNPIRTSSNLSVTGKTNEEDLW